MESPYSEGYKSIMCDVSQIFPWWFTYTSIEYREILDRPGLQTLIQNNSLLYPGIFASRY